MPSYDGLLLHHAPGAFNLDDVLVPWRQHCELKYECTFPVAVKDGALDVPLWMKTILDLEARLASAGFPPSADLVTQGPATIVSKYSQRQSEVVQTNSQSSGPTSQLASQSSRTLQETLGNPKSQKISRNFNKPMKFRLILEFPIECGTAAVNRARFIPCGFPRERGKSVYAHCLPPLVAPAPFPVGSRAFPQV